MTHRTTSTLRTPAMLFAAATVAMCPGVVRAQLVTPPPAKSPTLWLAPTSGVEPVEPGTDPYHPPGIREGHMLIQGCIVVPDSPFGDRSYVPGSAWPGGYVPFEFAPEVTQAHRQSMLNAMWVVSQTSANINFVYRSNNEVPYVYVTNNVPSGAAGVSYGVGMSQATANEIAMASGYWDDTYTVAHELMHRLGFNHEQSRPDRDQYIMVNWNNIEPTWQSQFNISTGDSTLGIPYDYTSIMHYDACAASNCTFCTSSNSSCRSITTLDSSYQSAIGNRSSWGTYDEADLEAVYGTGNCVYAQAPGASGVGSLASPTPSLQLAAAVVQGGTVWCKRGSDFVGAGILSSPATYKVHADGLPAILR